MSICVCVFFFKQKTAYEMRISDWSSDVCSSDLAEAGRIHARPRATLHPRPDHRFLVGLAHVLKALDMARVENVAQPFEHPQDGQILLAADIAAAAQLAAFALGPVHRKSVVSGKCVSVRVDPGDRRFIHKKIKFENKRNSS